MALALPGFAGPSVPARSRTVNVEYTGNLYLEHATGTPKRTPALYGRPAAVPWTFCNGGSYGDPIRAMLWQDQRFNVVSGAFYYDVALSKAVTQVGQVETDAYPAMIASNGTGGYQNLVISGGQGYIHDLKTGAFTQITDPNFRTPCRFICYVDGYFVAKQGGTNTWQFSSLMNGLVWNGLDVGQSSLSSDMKVAMATSHRELWFFGTKNTEVWQNDGNASFPFSPQSGVFIEHGIAAPYSVQRLDNTLYWLGLDEAGTGVIWRANGYTPERISDHAVEYEIQQWPNYHGVVGFAFQLSGHAFYAIYSPHAKYTWLYDVGGQAWTNWFHWDTRLLREIPFVGRTQASGWGKVFIGGRNNGTIYELVLDRGVYADAIVTAGALP